MGEAYLLKQLRIVTSIVGRCIDTVPGGEGDSGGLEADGGCASAMSVA